MMNKSNNSSRNLAHYFIALLLCLLALLPWCLSAYNVAQLFIGLMFISLQSCPTISWPAFYLPPALHCAASRGNANCIDLLVKNGADVDTADKNGCTPIFYAITLEKDDSTKKLLKHNADPSCRDKRGRTLVVIEIRPYSYRKGPHVISHRYKFLVIEPFCQTQKFLCKDQYLLHK